DTCGGARFNRATLAIRYRGHSVADVLGTPIAGALELFADTPAIHAPLEALAAVTPTDESIIDFDPSREEYDRNTERGFFGGRFAWEFDDGDEIYAYFLRQSDYNSDNTPRAAIVAAIENDPTEKQVPLAQVQMNPFTPVHVEKTEVAAQDDGAAAEAERQAQLRRLYAELARIEIQSLVGGSRPRAFIGGDLLKVGDRVGSFTIRAIDNRRVVFDAVGFELRAKEPRFIRGMDQGK
ncbi:MAG: hypothetical protein AAFX76_09260, partial [Planctomycetota bacterium]